jgi:hypothetical protein
MRRREDNLPASTVSRHFSARLSPFRSRSRPLLGRRQSCPHLPQKRPVTPTPFLLSAENSPTRCLTPETKSSHPARLPAAPRCSPRRRTDRRRQNSPGDRTGCYAESAPKVRRKDAATALPVSRAGSAPVPRFRTPRAPFTLPYPEPPRPSSNAARVTPFPRPPAVHSRRS